MDSTIDVLNDFKKQSFLTLNFMKTDYKQFNIKLWIGPVLNNNLNKFNSFYKNFHFYLQKTIIINTKN